MDIRDFTSRELLMEIQRRRIEGELLTAADVTRRHGMSKQHINQLKDAGRLPFIKSDSNSYIEADDIKSFIDNGGLKFRRKVAK